MTVRPNEVRLMLDSGAFSAWTHEETISLADYITFVKQVKNELWTYVNLDVIPGSINRIRSREEVEVSAKASYDNLRRMRDAGLRPMPVFHQGESFKWLEKMIEDGETYIGISTAKNQRESVQRRWLDYFFTAVTDHNGRPLVRVHGFGSAHIDLLKRLPWQSVDSAGWAIAPAYGQIYVPRYPGVMNGPPDYLAAPQMVWVCERDSKHTSKSGSLYQFAKYGPIIKAAVERFLEEEVGCTIGHVQHDQSWRDRALVTYYVKVAEHVKDVRFHEHKPNILENLSRAKGRPVKINEVQFVFSTGYDGRQYKILTDAGARYHLLSYYELKNRPEAIGRYLRGECQTVKRKMKATEVDFKDRRYRDYRARHLVEMMLEKEAGNVSEG